VSASAESATAVVEPDKVRTVVVIDDNAIDLILYRRVIQRSGFFEKLLTFEYAEDALAHFERHPDEAVDAILLDINMPRMNGFEFLEHAERRLENLRGACVVIMLTTSLDPDDLARSHSFSSVRGYVNKPLTIDSLRDIVALVRERVGRAKDDAA